MPPRRVGGTLASRPDPSVPIRRDRCILHAARRRYAACAFRLVDAARLTAASAWKERSRTRLTGRSDGRCESRDHVLDRPLFCRERRSEIGRACRLRASARVKGEVCSDLELAPASGYMRQCFSGHAALAALLLFPGVATVPEHPSCVPKQTQLFCPPAASTAPLSRDCRSHLLPRASQLGVFLQAPAEDLWRIRRPLADDRARPYAASKHSERSDARNRPRALVGLCRRR
jgi:hypothetical protein